MVKNQQNSNEITKEERACASVAKRAVCFVCLVAVSVFALFAQSSQSLPEWFEALPYYTNGDTHSVDSSNIWGLTPPVAIRYGLKITNDIDERRNINKSTIAAKRYFTDLLLRFQNERLTALCFLNTPAAVRDAAQKSNIDLVTIQDEQVSALASHLQRAVVNFDATRKITLISDEYIRVAIDYPVKITDFCGVTGERETDFRARNPELISDILPAGFAAAFINEVDTSGLNFYIQKQQHISDSINAARKAAIEAERALQSQAVTYVVKQGDTLSAIAKRYKVSVQQIKKWNNLKSDMIRINQKLKIYR